MNTFCNKLNLIIAILLSAFSIIAHAQCSVELGNNQTICANQSVVFIPTVTGTTGTVSYQWSPMTYMNTSQNGATQANPIVSPQQTTTYNVTITDGAGCTATDAITLTTSGAGPLVNISATPRIICAGMQTNLDFNSIPVACGANYAGCSGSPDVDSVGFGAYQQVAGSPQNFNQPTPYGQFWQSTRMQMLYTAAELTAQIGGGAGTITSLGWRVGAFNGGMTLQNYTIKIKCVPANVTQLSSTWETGLTTVYTANTYTPIFGWNTHPLQTQFNWDGSSGLIIEICTNSPGLAGNQIGFMKFDSVPNGIAYSMGNSDQCTANNNPTLASVRPFMRMAFCRPNYSQFTINWTPATGPNAVNNPNIRTPTANPQTTQTYMVSVSQGAGCAGTNYVTVVVDTTVKVNVGPDRPFCLGQTIGLSATSSGSPLPPNNAFTYQWRQLPSNTALGGNNATINVTPTATTSYYVTMSGGPCPVYDTVTLTVGSLPINMTPTNILCNGANNGSILATPNGVSPYTYTWSPNASTGNVNQATGLGVGTYTVTVSDNNTCTGTATASITQPTALAFTAPSIKNTSCNGSTDGQIAVFATGGTPGYTFNWSSGIPSNDTAYNLGVGTYTVTVYDANQCSATAQHAVTQPTPVAFGTTTVKDVRCFNGSDGIITVTGTGGTGPYHYAWSHNGALTTNTANNLAAGNYTVTVFDVNNCSVVSNPPIAVAQPATGLTLPTPTFVPVTCNGGSNGTATANPQGGAGGYEYLWSNAGTTQTITGLIAGTYSVTVEDDSLCTATNSVNVSQPPAIQIAGAVTSVSCNGGNNGAIDITVTNGVGSLTYTWSNSATTQDISGLVANTYTVTVRDLTQCTASASFTVNQPVALALGNPTIQHVSCFGGNNGSITANPTGGTGTYGYAWTPTGGITQTINGLAEGTYTVTVTDANQCTITAQYQVTQPASAVAFGVASVTNVLCNGAATGAIATSVSGGTTPYTYSWSHNALLNNTSALNLTANTYTITVTDANQCTASQSNTVTQPSAITFTAQPSITNVSCNGNTNGSAEVFPTGGVPPYSYRWNGNAGTNPQGNLAAGNYTVAVTDNNSCSVTVALTITEPGAINIASAIDNVSCFNGTDGSIALTITGGTPGFTYAWSNAQSTQTATGLSEGNYFVTVTDSRNCTASAAAYVDQPDPLTVSAQSVQVSCAGSIDGSITASAVGGTQPWHYILQFSGTDIADNFTGVFNGLNAGDYIVRVSDFNNCTASTNVNIASPVADTFSISSEPTSCYGEGFTDGIIYVYGLTPINQPYQFQLDGGPAQFSNDFYNVSAGEHTVTATNYFGCVTNLPITVTAPAEGIAEIMPGDTIVQVGETIQLFSILNPYHDSTINGYSWGPVLGLSCTDCPNPYLTSFAREQEYTVTITYNDLCKATATMRIIVDNNLQPYVPNAFSPNGDGNNDKFMIYGEGIKTIEFKIFNRWGEAVYETNSQYGGWDGTYKGTIQNPGVYTYSVKIVYLDDIEVNRKGSITLIR